MHWWCKRLKFGLIRKFGYIVFLGVLLCVKCVSIAVLKLFSRSDNYKGKYEIKCYFIFTLKLNNQFYKKNTLSFPYQSKEGRATTKKSN